MSNTSQHFFKCCTLQVSLILARDEDHPSPGEDESDKDEAELPELECVPEEGGEGACKAEPRDAKQADQAYIEALELLKFDTAELVVRIQIVLCSSRRRCLFCAKKY